VVSSKFASAFSKGVGRRILILFLVAALVPVLFTAFLAYSEINRGIRQEVHNSLKADAKAYGVDVLTRLMAASDKSQQIGISVERNQSIDFQSLAYLFDDFETIWIQDEAEHVMLLHGNRVIDIDVNRLDRGHLADGESQLIPIVKNGRHDLVLVRQISGGDQDQNLIMFDLRSGAIWGPSENLPYMTEFCVFAASGNALFCTEQAATGASYLSENVEDLKQNKLLEGEINGELHLVASWQLFMAGAFRHPAFDIVAAQPLVYALRSSADFRRVFPPALALVIVLVGFLSFNLIGRSLVPLRRLTAAAGKFASGQLASRVRMRTGDEFQDLGDAFNNMAERLGQQIATLKAMSDIDRMILSGSTFEEVCECVVGHLVELSDCSGVAVVAKDDDSPNRAKMISYDGTGFEHERILAPQETGADSTKMRVIDIASTDRTEAPYKEYFESAGQDTVVVIPVILNGDLKGRLLLGTTKQSEIPPYVLQRCVEIAGRLAVASASVEREEELYRQAHFDELTGLPNRQLLMDRLEQQLVHARRDGEPGAMLFLDLDRFKEINDVFGHSVGDIVLVQAAERIISEVRGTDTVARLGGDEFVIIMPRLTSDEPARATAGRLLTRLSEAFTARGNDHFVSVSIGIVMFPEDGDSVETLLKNADSAMYRAKDAGRSRYEFFSARLNAESSRRIRLERDLRTACQDDSLEVYYQPQFNISDNVISGAEALVRWPHPEQGFIPPSEFIPLAEDSALILDVGRWVIERTCQNLREILDKRLHPGPMSINVSARQLRDEDFIKDVLEPLHRYDIHPGFLQLEITETTVAQNRDTAIGILETLRESGVKVAMDDFGTGYSSLSYLQDLPFDLIKIDKSFVDLISSGTRAEMICRTIITMAHELGKEAMAEGVETQEQADFLAANNCDYVQGYFYSLPLPHKEFVEFIEQQDFHTMRRKALEIV
jgi:diguanylate cyclase (GGDEF)-like protein